MAHDSTEMELRRSKIGKVSVFSLAPQHHGKDFLPLLITYRKRKKTDTQTDYLKIYRSRLETLRFTWLCMFKSSDWQGQAKG